MLSEIQKQAKQILDKANGILIALENKLGTTGMIVHADCDDEAINWADLSFVECEYFINDEGQDGFRLLIEELSPNCYKFPTWLKGQLEDKGLKVAEIVCEW